MQALFISYRHSDSEGYTGRLYDRLVANFGKDQVFKDVDSIPLGVDFRTHLNAVISQCRAILVVVGPHWIDASDEAGTRRLENPDDFVRIEVEAALAREVPVIPVLVSGAIMPAVAQLPPSLAEFAYRHATPVRPDPDFHRDVDRLVAALQPLFGGARQAAASGVPASSSDVRRTNLPKNLPVLIGRAELVSRVVTDLNQYSLVTLAGFGGVGKTRLAQQVGADLVAGFPNGVWFIDLAGLNADEEVVPTVARTLRVREYSVESPIVTLVAVLRDYETLLILDNCERFTQSIAALVEEVTAAAPKVRFLTTSRAPLGVYGEKIVRVQGLDESSAVALFEARAAQARADAAADPSVVGELCRRLDFVPLAIELAAAQVRSLTPAEILTRVEERIGALRATERRAARHQTLEALVAWSYDLLTEPEQRLLNRLSVFVGSFDLASTERVCAATGIEADAVVDLLDRLVDKSLVAASAAGRATRFQMMDTVRRYAARKLEAAGEQAQIFERHTRYFSTQAQSLGDRIRGGDTRGSSAALLFDIDNVSAAIDRLGRTERHTEKARLVVALDLFWQLNAPRTGRLRYEQLVAVLDQIDPDVRFLTLLEAASFFSNLGFAARAAGLLDRARGLAREHCFDLPPYFFYVAATVAEMDGRPEDVLSLCDAGTAVLGAEDEFSALTLRSRALTSVLKLRPEEALEHARATLRRAQACGLDLFVSVSHMLIGTVHMVQGRLAESEPEFSQAIELAGEAMPQVTISAMIGAAAGCRSIDPARSIERARQALATESQSDIMPWFRVIAAELLAWHWAGDARADDAVLALAAMHELRQRLGFAGMWWAQSIRDEAWARVRHALPAERISELTARGKSLTVGEVRRLLGCEHTAPLNR